MINKTSELKCNCCGMIFNTEYYHGGSIEHSNYTESYNMNVMVSRFRKADSEGKYRLFLDSITLYENLCNMKDHTYIVGVQIFECRVQWLGDNGHDDVLEFIESNRCNINQEFNKVAKAIIDEKMMEVRDIEERLL